MGAGKAPGALGVGGVGCLVPPPGAPPASGLRVPVPVCLCVHVGASELFAPSPPVPQAPQFSFCLGPPLTPTPQARLWPRRPAPLAAIVFCRSRSPLSPSVPGCHGVTVRLVTRPPPLSAPICFSSSVLGALSLTSPLSLCLSVSVLAISLSLICLCSLSLPSSPCPSLPTS